MTEALVDQIAHTVRQKTTEELLEIWEINDRGQWSDAAFDAIAYTLSERGVVAPPQGVFVRVQPVIDPRYKGVRGWLLFFCVSLTILNPAVILGQLRSSFQPASRLFELFPVLRTISMVEAIMSILTSVLSIYAGACLWRLVPGAVTTAKGFLWFILARQASDIILLFTAGLPSAISEAMIPNAVGDALKTLIFFGVWYSYLSASKRVKATYGY